MARRRDYLAEYSRRVQRSLARGLSRSQARGHPRPGEVHVSVRTVRPAYDRTLEEGLKEVRSGRSVAQAARSVHVSPERLRDYLAQTGVAEKRGGRWMVMEDQRPRAMPIYSKGRELEITVAGHPDAAFAGRYMAAVGLFLDTNDPSYLAPFEGEGVGDVRGRWHPFETRPNELYRLTEGGPAPFEEIYKILA